MARAIDCGELEKRISSLARLARSDAQKSLLGRVLYIVENMPTLTHPNEPLTCDGCYWKTHGSFGPCINCAREKKDNYRRPPEGEEAITNVPFEWSLQQLKECSTYGFKQEICGEAAKTLSTLQAENVKLRAELEKVKAEFEAIQRILTEDYNNESV